MSRVNTKEKIMQAGLKLFVELGYQKTSIAKIETEAGLVPRAGAFYRHFESKEALLVAAAKTYVSETPEDFGLDRLRDYGDTKAELVAIALKYEEAMQRQAPYARLIDEIRLLDIGDALQEELDRDMMQGLRTWISEKALARALSGAELDALVINVIGAWLNFNSLAARNEQARALRDTVLEQWSSHWAQALDGEK